MTTLGKIAEYVTSGSRDWSKYYASAGAIFIRTQDINQNRLSLEKIAYVALPDRVEGKRSLVKRGDLLITITGANVGKVAVVDFDVPEAYVSQSVCLVRLKDPGVAKFVQLQLIARKGEKSTLEVMAYGLGRPVLNLENIRSAPVLIGDGEAQRRIVAEIEKQFSRLDEAVANLQRVKANLKRYKASVLKAALEGRLVPTEAELARREGRRFENGEQLLLRAAEARRIQWSARGSYAAPEDIDLGHLPGLPDGWVWATTDQISDFITKGTTPAASRMSDGSGEVQFLKVYNLTFDGTLNHGHKPVFVSKQTHGVELARSKVRPGDVLINIVGPPLGQVSVIPCHLTEANINQAIARIRPVEPIPPRFIAMALMCDDIMGWAIRQGKTTAGQANLTLELCRRLPVPLPPVAEQNRIVSEVDRRLSIVREVESEVDTSLKRANTLRRSALQSAFSQS